MTATNTTDTTGKTAPARKAPSRRNGTATKTTKRKAPAARKTASPTKTPPPVTAPEEIASKPIAEDQAVDQSDQWQMIAVTAYHKAEQRGFVPGYELTDWLEAEHEVRATLQGG